MPIFMENLTFKWHMHIVEQLGLGAIMVDELDRL